MPNKNILFIVPSAINTNHGVYGTQDRMDQTLQTLESIKSTVGATIAILDGGLFLDKSQEKILSKYASYVYDFSKHKAVKEIHNSIKDSSILKNYIELYMISVYLKVLKDAKSFQDFYRIFKISSRYVLTNKFSLNEHLEATNKIALNGPYSSPFNSELTDGVVNQFMCRLWSFDGRLLEYVSETYHNMLFDFMEKLKQNKYLDTEHLLYKHIDQTLIKSLNPIGVGGNIALNGVEVDE